MERDRAVGFARDARAAYASEGLTASASASASASARRLRGAGREPGRATGGGASTASAMIEREDSDASDEASAAAAAALRDRVEALKVRIDERYRATRRAGDASESLFEPASRASARMKEQETERALARLITRANLEGRAEMRRSQRLNDSATTLLSPSEYDEIFSEKSTEGSFHGYSSTGKHARRSSFEDERIKFDSALPSVMDEDDDDVGGRRNPTPGRTRTWLAKSPTSPKRGVDAARQNKSANSVDDEEEEEEYEGNNNDGAGSDRYSSAANILKSPRRNGSFKMLSPEAARTMAAEEALRPRARRALHGATTTTSSPDAGSPKSPSERSFSRTSSTLSITSLCTSDRPSSAFSPVAKRSTRGTPTTSTQTLARQRDAPRGA